MTELKGRHVMNRRVTAATPRAIGRDLALQLLSGMYSGLPVINDRGQVIGVVTEFEFALHPVGPVVLGGDILWPLERAREVLEFYAEYSQGLSDEMYTAPEMLPMPDGSGLIGVDVCYAGDIAAGERELAPLRQLGTPVNDTVAPTPYLMLQARLDGIFRGGIRSYIKSGMVREFTPALLDSMIERALGPSAASMTEWPSCSSSSRIISRASV